VLRPSSPRHGPVAQLLVAWAPLGLILLVYAVAEWVSDPLGDGMAAGTNRLGLPLHVTGPADVDRDLFGVVPSVWLQQHLVDGSAHWWDAIAALVYVTHFVSIPLLTAVVWFHRPWRERFSGWVVSVLALATLGMSGYVVYPAAPPWLASSRGDIGHVERISNLGWDWLHLGFVGSVSASGQGGSNPVAAMPSLHAAAALLVAVCLWPLANRWWRVVLLAYVLAMGATLVYTGEHYVVDVLAGWLTAAAAAAVARFVCGRERENRQQPADESAAPAGGPAERVTPRSRPRASPSGSGRSRPR
jgi:membrane-associated phospholipid phosphatase